MVAPVCIDVELCVCVRNVGKESNGSLLKELDPEEVNWCNVTKEGVSEDFNAAYA